MLLRRFPILNSLSLATLQAQGLARQVIQVDSPLFYVLYMANSLLNSPALPMRWFGAIKTLFLAPLSSLTRISSVDFVRRCDKIHFSQR